jgi:hypothetical protein
MNTTDIERPNQTVTGSPSAAPASRESSEGKTCASGGCSSAKYRAVAFLVPFVAVTAYSLTQETSCAVSGAHACAASAVALGALAGLTSIGLVTGIKALKAKMRAGVQHA